MKVPLEKARICLECDTIHDLVSCPECGSASFQYVARWIPPQHPPKPGPARPPFPILELPESKKQSHWLRNSVMAGAGLVAAWQLLFKRSRKKPADE